MLYKEFGIKEEILELSKEVEKDIEPIFRELKMGRAGDNGENEYTSLPPFRVKNAKFSIPVKEDGTFDLDAQKAIAQKYAFIDQMKDTIREKLDSLISPRVKL